MKSEPRTLTAIAAKHDYLKIFDANSGAVTGGVYAGGKIISQPTITGDLVSVIVEASRNHKTGKTFKLSTASFVRAFNVPQ